jgi:hypothetical protein
MNTEQLINKIMTSTSLEAMQECSDDIATFFKEESTSEDEKNKIRGAIIKNHEVIMSKVAETKRMAEQLLSEMDNSDIIIEKGGKRYDLAEWITPSEYAKKYAIKSAQIVSNWIARGLIPSENILKIDRLKLSLVRDIENIR